MTFRPSQPVMRAAPAAARQSTLIAAARPAAGRHLTPVVVALTALFMSLALVLPSASARASTPFCSGLIGELKRGGSQTGLMVKDLGTGRALCGYGANRRLILASNTKLYTTAALLARLGPGTRLATTVWRVGEVDRRGTLHGDLYLRGAGDPALAMPAYANARRPRVATNLLALRAQVRAAGIKRVTGRLYADDTIFDRRRGVADSGYRTSQYIGPLSGLALNSGYTGVGAKYFSVDPALLAAQKLASSLRSAGIQVNSQVRLGKLPPGPPPERGSGDDRQEAQNGGGGGGNRDGGEAQGGAGGSQGNSGGATGGNSVAGASAARASRARPRARIGLVRSPRMALLAEQVNVHSDNFFAETLIKLLGARARNKGTTAAGAQVVMRHARSVGSDAVIVDGSGLTRGNKASPEEVVRLLTETSARPYGDAFFGTLPLSTRDGTLAGRMAGTAAERRCNAKTGTLTGVSALSGYCRTRSGRTIAFSILMNGVGSASYARSQQDRIAARIAGL